MLFKGWIFLFQMPTNTQNICRRFGIIYIFDTFCMVHKSAFYKSKKCKGGEESSNNKDQSKVQKNTFLEMILGNQKGVFVWVFCVPNLKI